MLLSEVDERTAEFLKQSLEKAFQREVEVRAEIQSLDYAYDSSRKQYVSPRLLARLRRIKKARDDKLLGIADADLYSPGYDFIFGEAEVDPGVATLSLYRLRPERYGWHTGAGVFEERVIKEAVHELGHLYHLGHCPNRKCVMHFSISIADVDAKGREFCSGCRRRFEEQRIRE